MDITTKILSGYKICIRCKQLQHPDLLIKHSNTNDSWQCSTCNSSLNKKWRATERGLRYHISRWKRVGVLFVSETEEDEWLSRFLTATNCAICNISLGNGKKRCLHHNHDTGKPICITCNRCNQIEGFIRDGRVQKVIDYLKENDPDFKEKD